MKIPKWPQVLEVNFATYPAVAFLLIFAESRSTSSLVLLLISVILGGTGWLYIQDVVAKIRAKVPIERQRRMTLIQATRRAVPNYVRYWLVIAVFATLVFLSAAALVSVVTSLTFSSFAFNQYFYEFIILLFWGLFAFVPLAYVILLRQRELRLEWSRLMKETHR